MEFVDIWNKHSGARISTYVIFGARGSRCCVLNGAAARTCQKGDPLIICSSVYAYGSELPALRPRVLTFDAENSVIETLTYRVTMTAASNYSFEILDEQGEPVAVPALVGIRRGNN
jgi:aspartate 1-decarboxylase